jgi:hypothetical protein
MGSSESREQDGGKEVGMPSFLELMQSKADETERNAVAHADKWFAEYVAANDAARKESISSTVKMVMECFSANAGTASREFTVTLNPPFLQDLHAKLKTDTALNTVESARQRARELARETANIHCKAILSEFSRVTGVPMAKEGRMSWRHEPHCKVYFGGSDEMPYIQIKIVY